MRREQLGWRRVEQVVNAIVDRELLDAKQRLDIGGFEAMFHAPLMQ
ncbi:MAG: hypothetical protein WCA21_00960 [Terracidiphilus sp.]